MYCIGIAMLFVSTYVSIPKDTGYYLKSGKHYSRYIYLRTYHKDGKLKHDVLCIGRKAINPETNEECLNPNDNYYKHYNLEPPVGVEVKGCGQTKKSVPKRYHQNNENSVLGFGYGIAMFGIAKKLGIESILTDIFGSEIARNIIGLAMFYCDSYRGLTELEYFTERQMCFTNSVLTADSAYKLFSDIDKVEITEFFRKWAPAQIENDVACYDVTSLSSYAEQIPGVEYGYNRDKEELPQLNIGMFSNVKTGMPIAYEIYNGSINDFTNFPYVVNNAADWGLNKKFLIVMDGGFADPDTVDYVNLKDYDCLVGIPLSRSVKARKSVLDWRKENNDAESFSKYSFEDDTVCREVSFSISANTTGRLFMYCNLDSFALQRSSVQKEINSQREILKNLTHISEKEAKKFKHYFSIEIHDDLTFSFEIKQDVLANDLNLCGTMVLFTTSPNISAEQALELYRKKDVVEKNFGDLKNNILGERIRVHKRDALTGKFFVSFISLILRTELHNKLKSWIKTNKSSVLAVIHQLENIECVKRADYWLLDKALTRVQKELIKILEIPIRQIDINRE